ncbi:unnamed protein product [Boreogadus saida]
MCKKICMSNDDMLTAPSLPLALCKQQSNLLISRYNGRVVGLNKTKTRNSLALDGTLSSIMTIKMADLEPCFKWEPPSDVLKASKKDIGQYNRAHRS